MCCEYTSILSIISSSASEISDSVSKTPARNMGMKAPADGDAISCARAADCERSDDAMSVIGTASGEAAAAEDRDGGSQVGSTTHATPEHATVPHWKPPLNWPSDTHSRVVSLPRPHLPPWRHSPQYPLPAATSVQMIEQRLWRENVPSANMCTPRPFGCELCQWPLYIAPSRCQSTPLPTRSAPLNCPSYTSAVAAHLNRPQPHMTSKRKLPSYLSPLGHSQTPLPCRKMILRQVRH